MLNPHPVSEAAFNKQWMDFLRSKGKLNELLTSENKFQGLKKYTNNNILLFSFLAIWIWYFIISIAKNDKIVYWYFWEKTGLDKQYTTHILGECTYIRLSRYSSYEGYSSYLEIHGRGDAYPWNQPITVKAYR